MKLYVYPADDWACGRYRLAWPAQQVMRSGELDIDLSSTDIRNFRASINQDRTVRDVHIPEDADGIVIQRPTHTWLAQSVEIIRKKGVAVIVDMDDDLSTVHPGNPAFHVMHPKYGDPQHSWQNAALACRHATLVTVSTPKLLKKYAAHGRGLVLRNAVPSTFLAQARCLEDDVVSWCGSLHSHPNDLPVLGTSISNIVRSGYRFRMIGNPEGVGPALGLGEDLDTTGPLDIADWPENVARATVTVAPLADTEFNSAKSWLKPLEAMAAGVPVVMSPRDEYRYLHEQTGCGILAEKPKHWDAALRRLLSSSDLRQEESDRGRAAVRERYTIEACAWRWAEAWADAVATERGKKMALAGP